MKTIETIAASLIGKSYDDHDLQNEVFSAVCALTDAEWESLADLSLDPNGAPANGSRARFLYPYFADPCVLGEFDNLEAAQALCQKIYDAVREMEGDEND